MAVVSKISSKAGTERATHFHADNHWILCTEGIMAIYERRAGSTEKPVKIVLNPGDLHFTDSNVEHTMAFFSDHSFMCFSNEPRDSDNYEKNLTRLPISLKEIFDNWPES